MGWESKDFVGYGSAVILTIILTKGVPWLTTWLRYRSGEGKLRMAAEARGYESVIKRLDERVKYCESKIESLEAKFESERQEHIQCREERAELRQEVENLKRK